MDNATRKLGQETNKVTGIDKSCVNPNALDYKEALREAREKLGIGHNNQQDNAELTGDTPEHNES